MDYMEGIESESLAQPPAQQRSLFSMVSTATFPVAPPSPEFVDKGAVFSICRTWRYQLHRIWDESKPLLNVIGLNPSTADEQANDPTIERCQRRAKAMGMGGLLMTNLFAFRATDPRDMKAALDPVGSHNDVALLSAATRSSMILCAWGTHGAFKDRARYVESLLGGFDLYCLGKSKDGYPKHPLYIGYNVQPSLYIPKDAVNG